MRAPVGRLADAFADLDPAGLKLALGLKALVAVPLAASLAWLFARAIPDLALPSPLAAVPGLPEAFSTAQAAEGLRSSLPIVAGGVALNLFILVPGAGWAREFGRFLAASAIALSVLAGAGLAGPADLGMGALPASVLWIALIAAGLYARRWGEVTAKLGILAILVGLLVVATNPTRAAGFWYPPTVVLAVIVAFALRFLTLRPSALAAFRVRAFDLLAEVEAALARAVSPGAAAGGGADGAPFAESAALRRRWTVLNRALDQALAEQPRAGPRLRAQVVAVYRMILAFEVIADALATMSPRERERWLLDERLGGAVARLGDRLVHPVVIGFPSEERTDPALPAFLDDLLGRGAPLARVLQPARVAVGLRRLERVLNDFFAGRSEVETAAMPGPQPDVAAEARREAARGAGRLALQGLVAASITTLLQVRFELDHAYWATLTVALVLMGPVGSTLLRTARRAVGTAIGVALAIALVPAIGAILWAELLLVLFALLVTVLTIDRFYGVASGAIGFVVATGVHVLSGADIAEMAARAYETFIGAGVALLVTLLVLPSFSARFVRDRLAGFLAEARDAFEAVAAGRHGAATVSAPLAARLQATADEIPNAAAERLSGASREELYRLLSLLDALVAYVGLYEGGRALAADPDLPAAVRARLADLDRRLAGSLAALADLAARPAPGARKAPPVLFEREGVSTTELAGALEGVEPRRALAVIDHGYYGNRLGRTVNDLAGPVARLA